MILSKQKIVTTTDLKIDRMDYSSEKLRKLQLVQLLSLLEIKRICDKHNIQYTPIGGTLLGTIRHKGFIPWDNDIDVGMLREEYNKFLEVAKNELRPDFFCRHTKQIQTILKQ